jgi:hypothetical protein
MMQQLAVLWKATTTTAFPEAIPTDRPTGKTGKLAVHPVVLCYLKIQQKHSTLPVLSEG